MSDTYTNHIRVTGTPEALSRFAEAAKDKENIFSFQKLAPVSPKSGEKHLANAVKKWGFKSQGEVDVELCELDPSTGKLHFTVETNGNTAEAAFEKFFRNFPEVQFRVLAERERPWVYYYCGARNTGSGYPLDKERPLEDMEENDAERSQL